MFDSLVLTWERNFEVTFGIFSVLVSQINVLESYLDTYLFKISYDRKCENCDNLIKLRSGKLHSSRYEMVFHVIQ